MPDQVTRLLDEVERLDEAASTGPWIHGTSPDDSVNTFFGQKYCECCPPGEGGYGDLLGEAGRPDAEFIALARSFAPAAAQALRAVLDVLDDYTVPGKLHDPTGSTAAELESLEGYIREAIDDAMGVTDAA